MVWCFGSVIGTSLLLLHPGADGDILLPHRVLFRLEMGITGGSMPSLPPSRTKRDALMTLAIMM